MSTEANKNMFKVYDDSVSGNRIVSDVEFYQITDGFVTFFRENEFGKFDRTLSINASSVYEVARVL
jgi:hypothetical protein